ncbi:Rha family transcriptional regulator [Methylobacter svalbardensis]|uniref:Rha family transcriptional regulator n=1 Tax=Methylobacter svalbardensis TaxID=3080016 RepID=UPI0030ED5DBB
MNNVISLIEKKHEPRVDSLAIADRLGIQHKNALALIDDNKLEFGEFGRVAFETRTLETNGGNQKQRIAFLNEDQSYFLLTLTRNTKRTKPLKVELVKAFSRFRKHKQTTEDYLPFYHELHDNVKSLSDRAHQNGSQVKESFLHMNFNKLINKAFCLDAGQRPDLPPRLRAQVTAANVIAGDIVQRCVMAGLDHKVTYQEVKQAVFALAEPVRGLYLPSTQNRAFQTADTKNPEL